MFVAAIHVSCISKCLVCIRVGRGSIFFNLTQPNPLIFKPNPTKPMTLSITHINPTQPTSHENNISATGMRLQHSLAKRNETKLTINQNELWNKVH